MTQVYLLEDYGPFYKNHGYKVVKEGVDWVLLRKRGRVFYVSKDLVSYKPAYNPIEEVMDDFDEDWDEFFSY